MKQSPILAVNNLSIRFQSDAQVVALDDVSFSINRGSSLALLGASGSGKSLTSLAIMGLLPTNSQVTGSICFDQKLLVEKQDWNNIRGKRIAMIFQEPMSALNPLMTCGDQLVECIKVHQSQLTSKQAFQEALFWLKQVKLPTVEKLYYKYPHELSGGQKQRIMIAMALCNHPDLIIADEPTTALDVIVQKEILDLLKSLQVKHNCALLFITHDMGVAQYIADEVLILDKGKVVGNNLDSYRKSIRLNNTKDISSDDIILKIQDLSVLFTTQTNWWGKPKQQLAAVKNVNLDIKRGSTFGLVGGSGCGKSTISKCIMGIIAFNSGAIFFNNKSYSNFTKNDWQRAKKEIQMIFQDPHASLSPKMTIENMLKEVLFVHNLCKSTKEANERIDLLLEKVGLPTTAKYKYPHEFSGGQKQRLCIARALAVQPQFIICDESIAALDSAMQMQILELLKEIQKQDNLTYLFITHDLSIAEQFCDEIAVMKDGEIEEYGLAHDVLGNPQKPYTQLLKSAML